MKYPLIHDPRKTMTALNMCPLRPEFALSVEEEAEKRRLGEKRKHPLERKSQADHPAGRVAKARPVGSELELERNSGHDAEREVYAKNAGPKAGDVVVAGVAGAAAENLEDHDEERQAHRELRKQIVIRNRERELKSVPGKRCHGNRVRIP
jgi:hypothetical protein